MKQVSTLLDVGTAMVWIYSSGQTRNAGKGKGPVGRYYDRMTSCGFHVFKAVREHHGPATHASD